jgi:hypothetical protein
LRELGAEIDAFIAPHDAADGDPDEGSIMLAPPKQPKILLAEAEDGSGYCVTISPPNRVGPQSLL